MLNKTTTWNPFLNLWEGATVTKFLTLYLEGWAFESGVPKNTNVDTLKRGIKKWNLLIENPCFWQPLFSQKYTDNSPGAIHYILPTLVAKSPYENKSRFHNDLVNDLSLIKQKFIHLIVSLIGSVVRDEVCVRLFYSANKARSTFVNSKIFLLYFVMLCVAKN